MVVAPVLMKLDLQKELTEALEINEVFGFNIGSLRSALMNQRLFRG